MTRWVLALSPSLTKTFKLESLVVPTRDVKEPAREPQVLAWARPDGRAFLRARAVAQAFFEPSPAGSSPPPLSLSLPQSFKAAGRRLKRQPQNLIFFFF